MNDYIIHLVPCPKSAYDNDMKYNIATYYINTSPCLNTFKLINIK